MKNNKYVRIGIICLAFVSIAFTSCNIGGLELQQDAKYNYSPIKLTMDMTAYQYIESRKNNDMSLLYLAINKAGYKNEFEAQNRTYIVLNDIAFTAYLSNKKFANISTMSKQDITKMLNQYIIVGKYLVQSLTTKSTQVVTLDPTVSLGLAVLTSSFGDQAKYRAYFTLWGSTSTRLFVTSNLQPTNGVIHVTDSPL
jgi:hypothetical protein